MKWNISPVVIINLMDFFDGTVPSKIIFTFPQNSLIKSCFGSLMKEIIRRLAPSVLR